MARRTSLPYLGFEWRRTNETVRGESGARCSAENASSPLTDTARSSCLVTLGRCKPEYMGYDDSGQSSRRATTCQICATIKPTTQSTPKAKRGRDMANSLANAWVSVIGVEPIDTPMKVFKAVPASAGEEGPLAASTA